MSTSLKGFSGVCLRSLGDLQHAATQHAGPLPERGKMSPCSKDMIEMFFLTHNNRQKGGNPQLVETNEGICLQEKVNHVHLVTL